jgi:transcription initiation factor TFIIB
VKEHRCAQAPRLPVLARSASAFSGQLTELEHALIDDSAAASSNPDPAGPMAPPMGCC